MKRSGPAHLSVVGPGAPLVPVRTRPPRIRSEPEALKYLENYLGKVKKARQKVNAATSPEDGMPLFHVLLLEQGALQGMIGAFFAAGLIGENAYDKLIRASEEALATTVVEKPAILLGPRR